MSEFQPLWYSPPGNTIKQFLKESDRSLKSFCESLGISLKDASHLLVGEMKIDDAFAKLLSVNLGASKDFWLRRESRYREVLAAARIREEYESGEAKKWMSTLPLADMVKKRWIEPNLRPLEKFKRCLDYFDVQSVEAWFDQYSSLQHQVAFRTSDSFDSNPHSVIAWLRQGQIQAQNLDSGAWDLAKFENAVVEARKFTREPDPKVFIPEITKIFADCGVCLAIAPAPTGCRASGAVFFDQSEHAVLLLSFRYLSDDHFWFSFFHECGHLIFHSEQGLFLEGKGTKNCAQEIEADQFAAEILVPSEFRDEMKALSLSNPRQVLKFAKKVGVSPGILIGQLQNGGLGHDKFNRYKVRYSWT